MPISEAYNIDCMEYMRSIPDQHFDIAIVDPPYGLDKHSTHGRGKLRGRILNTGNIQQWPNFSQCELAWTSYDKPAKLFRFDNRTKDKIHPTQKPVELYAWLLSTFMTEGGVKSSTRISAAAAAA